MYTPIEVYIYIYYQEKSFRISTFFGNFNFLLKFAKESVGPLVDVLAVKETPQCLGCCQAVESKNRREIVVKLRQLSMIR